MNQSLTTVEDLFVFSFRNIYICHQSSFNKVNTTGNKICK